MIPDSGARAVASPALRIGISSWTDLPGFYPAGIKANDRLGWYARHFNVVEINVSFYRLVMPHTYVDWLHKTPTSLTFDVKAFRELTHERHASPGAIFRGFRESLQPLRESNRLGAILFQFPPGFTSTTANRAYVAALPDYLAGDRIVVEFRHVSWLDEAHTAETAALLRDHGMTLAVVDEPFLPPHTAPLTPIPTNDDLGYLRLHGRNAEGWFAGRDRRYDYDYSPAELLEIAEIVHDLARQCREVHVLFNNNSAGAGTINAQQLARLLGVHPTDTLDLPMRQASLIDLP